MVILCFCLCVSPVLHVSCLVSLVSMFAHLVCLSSQSCLLIKFASLCLSYVSCFTLAVLCPLLVFSILLPACLVSFDCCALLLCLILSLLPCVFKPSVFLCPLSSNMIHFLVFLFPSFLVFSSSFPCSSFGLFFSSLFYG